MKKINLLTTLSATFASVLMPATICSCSKPKEPVEPDHIKWDFKNNGFYVPQQIKEGAEGAKQYEAIDSYLSDAKQNPRPFLEDILYSENLEYFTLEWVTPGELLKYDVEYKINEISENYLVSLDVSRDIIFQPTAGQKWELKTNLTFENIDYFSKYTIEKQSGVVTKNWSFIPNYIGLTLEEFKQWGESSSVWSIKGRIENPLTGGGYDFEWAKGKISDITQTQLNYINQAYYGVSYSYYYSKFPIKGDGVFECTAGYGNYVAVAAQSSEYIVGHLNDTGFETNDYDIKLTTVQPEQPVVGLDIGCCLNNEYFFLKSDENGLIHVGTIQKNSDLILHINKWPTDAQQITFEIKPHKE